MIQLEFESFTSGSGPPSDLFLRLDRMFRRIFDRSSTIPFTIREFIDTTTGSTTRFLPDGRKSPDKDYFFGKSDVSVNTITITAFGTQTINGSTSIVLASQFNFVNLAWNQATLSWFITAFG